MKKRITAVIFMLVFCLLQIFPVYAQDQKDRMIDNAGLLKAQEIAAIEEKLDDVSARQNCDVTIVTVNSLGSKTATEFADDYFDENGYGIGEEASGILFLISMEARDWAISTHGFGITAFTDAGQEYIIEKIRPDLSEGYYLNCFVRFTELCDQFLTQAYTGEPYDRNNLPESKGPSQIIRIIIAIVIGTILSFILTQAKKSELKSVKAKKSAVNYVTHKEITRRNDIFLYKQVSKTAKPKNNGSSTHTSSSGRTHGGSSGKF